MRPQYDTGLPGPRVASDPHYKSSTLRPYSVRGKTYTPQIPDAGYSETGLASWYGYESSSRTTANGEIFDTDQMAAAHKTLPLPSVVEVTNLDTGKSVRVRVNDRGPFVDNRIIDLSRAAAKELGVYNSGTARVRVTFLGPAEPAAPGAPVPVRPAAAPSDDALGYVVQIGAFSQRDNAEAAQARLSGARLKQHDDLFIVYLGPYNGAGAAETHRQDAINAGFPDAILRRDE